MRTQTTFIFGVLLLAVCLTAPTYGVQTIPASDKCFCYEGRFDFNDINAPVVIWQASRISIDFEGDTLSLLFDRPTWQNFFNAEIDGSITIVEVNEGMPPKGTTFTGFGKGRHHLMLFKRSEASVGTVHFRGIQIAEGAQAQKPVPVAYKLTMEFIGDSKTVGACNEDANTDQWDNRRTHNSALSYAAMTADAFKADHRNISVSGMGVATGWVEVKAGQMWDKLYPNASSPPADLRAWTPDVVFVNIGDNDESFPKSQQQSFPAGFTDSYIALVRSIRIAYPKTHIVLLRGGVYGGMHSEPLNQAWKDVVPKLESGDKNISHFVFEHQSSKHPRVADHRAMADELITWLKQQDFMKAYK